MRTLVLAVGVGVALLIATFGALLIWAQPSLVLKFHDTFLDRSGLTKGAKWRQKVGSLEYVSEDYRTRLDAHGITCSMSRRGNCYDNAVMESWFSTVKSEEAERFELRPRQGGLVRLHRGVL